MDLGIAGRKAIVCASSKGLGKGCAMALAREGVNLVINARSADVLDETAEEIRSETGAVVTPVACDVTTPEGRAMLLRACPDPDILINNAGGPPLGSYKDFTPEDWQRAVNGNMITPIELIKATIDHMIAREFGRIVNITSSSVKAPIDVLCLSNGARSGLTGFVAGLAGEVARHNVTINSLLPGAFDTDRLRSGMAHRAETSGREIDEIRAESAAKIPAGRFGNQDEFGAVCAFMCSVHVGYLCGQNILLDGRNYPGTY